MKLKRHEWNETKPMWVIGTIDSNGAIRARASVGRNNPMHSAEDGPGRRWRWNVWGQDYHAVAGGHDNIGPEAALIVDDWLRNHGYVYDSMVKVTPVGRRGRQPTYQAKIGTMGSTTIIVKRAREFEVGQRLEFAEVMDLRGCSVGVTPRWRSGIVWLIEDDRLFINLN